MVKKSQFYLIDSVFAENLETDSLDGTELDDVAALIDAVAKQVISNNYKRKHSNLPQLLFETKTSLLAEPSSGHES